MEASRRERLCFIKRLGALDITYRFEAVITSRYSQAERLALYKQAHYLERFYTIGFGS